MLYNDFGAFARDQERLISLNGRRQSNALDYLEGSLVMNQGSIENWRSSFFPQSHHSRIISSVLRHKILYCLEVAKFYDDYNYSTVDKVHISCMHPPTLIISACPRYIYNYQGKYLLIKHDRYLCICTGTAAFT